MVGAAYIAVSYFPASRAATLTSVLLLPLHDPVRVAEPAAGARLDWPQLVERVEQAGQHHAAAIMRLQLRVVELAPP